MKQGLGRQNWLLSFFLCSKTEVSARQKDRSEEEKERETLKESSVVVVVVQFPPSPL